MTKRKFAWIVSSILFLASITGIGFGISAVHDITLTETQIQERIDEKLPLKKNGVIIKNMQVRLLDGMLTLGVEAEGKKLKQTFSLSGDISGVPYFNNKNGTFHFRPNVMHITEFKLANGDISEKVEKFIDRFVESPKINKNKEVIGSKIETWVLESVEKTTVFALEQMPIYTLPHDLKGNVVRMFLNSVEIGENTLTLHLSVWQFTKILFVYVVSFFIALLMTIGLLMNPQWGVPLLVATSVLED